MSNAENNNGEYFAEIHFFDKNLKTGEFHRDEYGEELIGHYYQLIEQDTDEAFSHLIGPYNSNEEAEEAAQRAFSTGDYVIASKK